MPGHLHPVNHSRKRPRVRDPGAHWDPIVPAPLSTVPAIPQLFCHLDSAQPAPEWGEGTVGVGSWTSIGHVQEVGPERMEGPASRDQTPRVCAARARGERGSQLKVSYWEEVPEVRRILQCPRERPQLSALGMRVVVGRWPQGPRGGPWEGAYQLRGPAGGWVAELGRPEFRAQPMGGGGWRCAALIGWRGLHRRARPPLHVCAGVRSWRQGGRRMPRGRSPAGLRPRSALSPAPTA